MLNIKTPEELLKWMDKNIQYEGKNKGYLRTLEQVINDGKAHCWETSELEYKVLTSLGYTCKILYLEDNNLNSTHSTVLYQDKKEQWFWFEWAWGKYEGIHGPYHSQEEVIDKIIQLFHKQYHSVFLVKLGHSPITKGMNEQNYIDKVHQWKTISISSDLKKKLNIASESRMSKYKEIKTSKENVEKYKIQFPNLRHVKVGDDFKGIILLDNDTFVAVLQCNIKTNFIVALEVSSKYQKQGIASSLLNKAVRRFKCNKLTVNKNNKNAIELYKNKGWKTYREDGAMLFMQKENVATEDYSEDVLEQDYNDILEWQLMQNTDVQENIKIVNHKDLEQDFFLHIDKNLSKDPFIPRMPKSAMKSENATVPRITVAPTLIGCMVGYFRCLKDFLTGPGEHVKGDPFKGGYLISEFKFIHAIKPTKELVLDAERSDEYWLVNYNQSTTEYKPIEIGKLFITEAKLTAVNQKEPSTELTVYLCHNKATGLPLNDKVNLEAGYYKLIVNYDSQSTFDVRHTEKVTATKITEEEYNQRKQYSATLLNYKDGPKYLAW